MYEFCMIGVEMSAPQAHLKVVHRTHTNSHAIVCDGDNLYAVPRTQFSWIAEATPEELDIFLDWHYSLDRAKRTHPSGFPPYPSPGYNHNYDKLPTGNFL